MWQVSDCQSDEILWGDFIPKSNEEEKKKNNHSKHYKTRYIVIFFH